MKKLSKLIFVYNADSGFFNALTDAAHKVLSPDTYACNLCAITYGNVSMKKEWKEYIASLAVPAEFLHKDELHKVYPRLTDIDLPAVFSIDTQGAESVVITAAQINAARSIGDLKTLVNASLS